MVDNPRNTHRPTDQIGEVSTNIQLARKEQLADLKQLPETNPALSSMHEAPWELFDVRVLIVASGQVLVSFPGCFPRSSAVRYVLWGAPQFQRRY